MSAACDNDPAALVVAIAEQLRNHVDEATRRIGMTAPQAKLLMLLDEPRRMSELAERQVCDPSSITSLVDRLERDGLVRRTADPCDGRVRRVVITPAGRRMRARFMAEMSELPDPFEALSCDQRRALIARLSVTDSVASS